MKNTVVFDLDGTLSLNHHRQHLVQTIPGGKKDWKAFTEASIHDDPHKPIIRILQSMVANDYRIIIASGREETVRDGTLEWFKKWKITFDKLLMRPEGDHTEDSALKRSWVTSGEIPIDDVLCVFEDRERMVHMWRSLGLTCLQVAEGNF